MRSWPLNESVDFLPDYFINLGFPETSNPFPSRIAASSCAEILSGSKVTITVCDTIFGVALYTPSMSCRIELTLSAVRSQTHPGTDNSTILSFSEKTSVGSCVAHANRVMINSKIQT